jgi:hypothetical protein
MKMLLRSAIMALILFSGFAAVTAKTSVASLPIPGPTCLPPGGHGQPSTQLQGIPCELVNR